MEPFARNEPIYWRVAPVAKVIGVPKRMFLRDVLEGRLPVPVRTARFGASGIVHVNADDVRHLLLVLNNKA